MTKRTDLIKTLRSQDAFDEIERLQKGRDIQKSNAERWESLAITYKRYIEGLRDRIDAKDAEIERLQKDNMCLGDECKMLEMRNDKLQAVVDAANDWRVLGEHPELDAAIAALENNDEQG